MDISAVHSFSTSCVFLFNIMSVVSTSVEEERLDQWVTVILEQRCLWW